MDSHHNILGLTNLDVRSHDNAACIISGRVLVAHAEEERFTRRKHAYDALATNAIQYCLEQAGLTAQQIDTVSIGWDLLNATFDKRATPALLSDRELIRRKIFPPNIFGETKIREVHFVPHHLAHATAAFHASRFRRAAVMIFDGAGETEATTLWHGVDEDLVKLHSYDQLPNSLGFMFEGVSKFLGFRTSDPGKVMGLASFGDHRTSRFDIVQLSSEGYEVCFPEAVYQTVLASHQTKDNYYWSDFIRELWIEYCKSLYGTDVGPHSDTPHLDVRKDIAMRVQKTLEDVLIHLAQLLKRKTGEAKIVTSGGVALNCSANGKLDIADIYDESFVYPASNDAGVALGGALHTFKKIYGSLGELSNLDSLRDNPYWGPKYSDTTLERLLRERSVTYTELDDGFKEVAKLIAEGNIIGWFQGRMEIGPRALGARSIVADPRRAEIRDRVNQLKGRESWRPLAPSVLAGHETDFFSPSSCSPFMLKASMVLPSQREVIRGVTHVDNSARYQSVLAITNPRYHSLINSFFQLTGVPIVLNTSFNHRSEPIVCTPEDALRNFDLCALDYLVLGRCLVKRKT